MEKPNKREENKLIKKGYKYIAGVDEVGRGPLAGPIVAVAVIFDKKINIKGINDSKKLPRKARDELAKIIKKKALAWSIAKVTNKQIDKIGIQKANEKVLINAFKKLKKKPDYILIDAFKINNKTPHKSIIKGDEKVFSIAAASILAKTERDKLMKKVHKKFPKYDFDKNVGYGTKKHISALKKYGPCPFHRLSFKPLNNS